VPSKAFQNEVGGAMLQNGLALILQQKRLAEPAARQPTRDAPCGPFTTTANSV
jgi:hypothetical protein